MLERLSTKRAEKIHTSIGRLSSKQLRKMLGFKETTKYEVDEEKKKKMKKENLTPLASKSEQ